MEPLIAVTAIFALALLAPQTSRLLAHRAGWLLSLLPFGLFAWMASLSRAVNADPPKWNQPWVPEIGLNLAFRLDGLALLFGLLITGIGGLVLVYAGEYMKGDPRAGRLLSFLLFFMGSMLGVVLADNLILLFVFWELTSVSSFLLIGFNSDEEGSRRGAIQALVVTGGGGLALLAGLVWMGQAAQTYEISNLPSLAGHPAYAGLFALVAIGCFTKSAQFPFHFWLPNAMKAPTPVSAYLHSATMVKAGVYLLARLSPTLGGTQIWEVTLTAVGGATMVVGGRLALIQYDLKRILAYTTVAALGTLVLALGIGGEKAAGAAMAFLLAHALYKGALFLVAGAVDHGTGTRDIRALSGLARQMPITGFAALLAGLSMLGVAPMGFLAKEMAFEAALSSPLAAVQAGALSLAAVAFAWVAFVVGWRIFRGTPSQPDAHEGSPGLWLGPMVLGLLGVGLGCAPAWLEGFVGSAAANSVMPDYQGHWSLWHGFNLALGLGVGCIVLGLVGARASERAVAWGAERKAVVGCERAYDAAIAGANRLAETFTSLVQSGRLRVYLQTTIGTTLVLLAAAMLRWTPDFPNRPFDVRPHEVLLLIAMLAGVIGAAHSKSRLSAVVILGVVGFGVALTYVLLGAPDLAMTQIAVEILTVILFVLTFIHLPKFQRASTLPTRLGDAAVATVFGAAMGFLCLVASEQRYGEPVSAYFVENSYPLAHGRNIVNVILVDFRGLDTMGEITVLALAGLGVVALWSAKRSGGGASTR